jgi:hypothetical protein
MQEPSDTIRNNIRHYENLLKADSPLYTHKNVEKLLGEARTQLRLTEIEERRANK